MLFIVARAAVFGASIMAKKASLMHISSVFSDHD